ncbi:MAG TPA: hypothetical protein EYN18_00910 [Nitrospirales bacterium]|jgi:hypothetical protein|nr:hypothetical protein [Nitrospirales bacterium]HIA13955.1 hypothetical protein [Nitrospirales bacterium]HIB54468.1 hypothetical protein [Nitrospirales bacterium]HIC03912.1 hypothetical protein [Nitrospirales bacterium]HIN32817.1 hypothetical protein [Nitrospirales bacterium]
MTFSTKRALTAVILVMLVCQLSMIPSVRAESTASVASAGIGAFFATLLYTPAKVTYAILGGLIGSAAYGLSGGDELAACRIWTPAFRGTYVLTPAHLRGQEPIRFAGLPLQTEEGPQMDLTDTVAPTQDAQTE